MRDFLNNEIQVGDRVVYCQYMKTSAKLIEANVVKLLPQKVRIQVNGVRYNQGIMDVYPDKLVVIK